MKKTYLAQCLKNGLVARWPDTVNTLKVYLEPFQWYHLDVPLQWKNYQRIALEGLALWSQVLEGKISFTLTTVLEEAHVHIKWRGFNLGDSAVEGGNCYRYVDERSSITSAMIHVNLTEGNVEVKNADEILKRSLIPLIGQALGLCSEEQARNVTEEAFMGAQQTPSDLYIRWQDVETLRWMYKLPVGFNCRDYLKQLSQNGKPLMQMTIDELVANLVENPATGKLSFVPPAQPTFDKAPQNSPFAPGVFSSMGMPGGATGGGVFPAGMRNRFMLQNAGR